MRTCRSCGVIEQLPALGWCGDCLRQFLKGVAAGVAAAISAAILALLTGGAP